MRKSTTIKKQNKNTFPLDFYLNLCYSYYMKITEKQIAEFAEANDMMPLAGDLFEDAGGHVWHESNIEDLIKGGKDENPDLFFPASLDHLFGDVAGALDALTIIK